VLLAISNMLRLPLHSRRVPVLWCEIEAGCLGEIVGGGATAHNFPEGECLLLDGEVRALSHGVREG
jgi:hypothetical protein